VSDTARYFDLVAPAEASTIPDAGRALSELEEISPQMRGAAILSEAGEVLAASGEPAAWEAAAKEMLAAADAAGGQRVAHAHVATADGEAFCVRERGLIAVAVTDRFVLSSLMIFDLRAKLRELRRADGR
jgi:hypothetical protein